MFFGILVFAAIYVLFIYGQTLVELNKSVDLNHAAAAIEYDESSCLHDSMYEVLLELQYHLSEMHAQLNEQMNNIHACGANDLGDEEASVDSAAAEWDYEFPPGKIVPPESSESTF